MKPYTLKFRKRDSEERAMMVREFATFPEAASWAYIRANKLGSQWYIEAISEKT